MKLQGEVTMMNDHKEKIKDIDLSCNLLCRYPIKDNYYDDDDSYCC